MYIYKAKVRRVIDGDTIKCDIDLGFDMWLNNISVRFAGLDAPETRTKDLKEKVRGYEAKDFVETQLEDEPIVTLEIEKLGKYGRPIANILLKDGSSLNQMLLDADLAILKEY